MLKKLTNKKGFTLMEMLIVVAIIAVLVAIAIPTFSGALTKAKEAADVANIRAYYAELQIKAIDGGTNAAPQVEDTAFKTAMTTAGYTLNYHTNLTYTKADGKLVYVASKLVDPDTGKTYTWTLGDATA